MKNLFYFFSIALLLCSCQQKESVDTIVYGHIYTVNDAFDQVEAMAIKEGKIVATGDKVTIDKAYKAAESIDYGNQAIYPGFIDAHAHFFGYGKTLQIANLRDTESWDEIVEILLEFSKDQPEGWIIGRGWDQNDWKIKKFPTKDLLDKHFPDRPVYLTRIDGHAAIVNQKALDVAEYTRKTRIPGGDLIQKNGQLTGVLIDNAMGSVHSKMPRATKNQVHKILKDAERDCLAMGLTTIVDAGLNPDVIEEIEALNKSNDLKMRLHVMLSLTDDNIDYLVKRGEIKTDRLHVNGFKAFADGALGSRGALLIEEYHDHSGHKGLLLMDTVQFRKQLARMYQHNFQVNTHAIGDDANRILLNMYGDFLEGDNDRRWRIEHAQVMSPDDFYLFGKYDIVPSVQPTHATSDMYWAGERLGAIRLKSAYAYKQLLDENGWIALGTDFPIEEIDPLLTFNAAVNRQDKKAYPADGFQMENALTREETLRGMTIWAAKGSFEENEKGSLEKGKFADFIVMDQDLMTISAKDILKTKVLATYINGEKLYEQK